LPEASHLTRVAELGPLQREQLAADAQPPQPAQSAQPVGSTEVQAKATSSPASKTECRALGPFREKNAAASAIRRLSDAGIAGNLRADTQQVRIGYWVYLPSYSSHAAAERAVARLRRAGYSDFYIIGGGEHQNAVSLGVFTEEDGADARAAQVGKFGFKPKIDDRFKDEPVYWVDMRVAAGNEPVASDYGDLIKSGDPALKLESRPCDSDTGPAPE
jgi:hypothetical protein